MLLLQTFKRHIRRLDTGSFLCQFCPNHRVFSGFLTALTPASPTLALTYKCQHWHEGPSSLHARQSVVEVKRLITVAPVSRPPTNLSPNPVSPLRESYCFNMNNEWLNLSSGCRRTARLDYFLGTAVTFIGLDSGRIGERPLLGWIGWVTDGDGQRQKERQRKREKCGEREQWHGQLCTPQWTAALQSLIEWEIQYPDLDWSSREKSSAATTHPRTVTKTHKIVEERQKDFFDISLCHIFKPDYQENKTFSPQPQVVFHTALESGYPYLLHRKMQLNATLQYTLNGKQWV